MAYKEQRNNKINFKDEVIKKSGKWRNKTTQSRQNGT